MMSYDVLTIYAGKVSLDTKRLRLIADLDVIVQDGQQTRRVQHAEVDFSARNPMSTLVTH